MKYALGLSNKRSREGVNTLLAVYFSGTGNTKFAVKYFCDRLSLAGVQCMSMSIESAHSFGKEAKNADTILIAYPIYGSDMPLLMKQFLQKNAEHFNGKDVITLSTQLFFSGDGAALAAKYLSKGAKIKHRASIHINMPYNASDVAIFKVRNGEQNKNKISRAKKKIDSCVARIEAGKRVKNGRQFYSWFLGFFGQRLWYRLLLEKRLRSALRIDTSLCIKCGKCAACCPTGNIEIGSFCKAGNKCSICYRCVNICPKMAISLLSKNKPREQYKGVDI